MMLKEDMRIYSPTLGGTRFLMFLLTIDDKREPPALPARPYELTQHNQPPPLRMLNFAKLAGSGSAIAPRSSKGQNVQHPGFQRGHPS